MASDTKHRSKALHGHLCTKCGTTWEHDPAPGQDLIDPYLHRCRCGKICTLVVWGPGVSRLHWSLAKMAESERRARAREKKLERTSRTEVTDGV